MRLILILLPALLAAQTATMMHISATRASVKIKGASGTCTGTLTNLDASETHPYVSAVDLSTLTDYVTWADGSRIVTLGRETGNDALRTETNYSLAISGCMTTTVPFRTPPVYFGSQPSRNAPFDSTKFGNRAWATHDFGSTGKNKIYTDSLTGIPYRLIPRYKDYGYKLFAGGNSFETTFYVNSGWTDPQKVAAGSTSNFGSISGATTPIDLFVPKGTLPWSLGVSPFWNWSIDNLGLMVWCGGDDATATNRRFKVGAWNGAEYLMHQTIECAQGATSPATIVKRDSASADADKPWPDDFEEGGYLGWTGKLTRDTMPQDGTLVVTGGSTFTISSPGDGSNIPAATVAGAKILITGSGCTPFDLCTIASITNGQVGTIAETIANATYSYTLYPWTLRVEKTTATGKLNLGLKWKAQSTEDILPVTNGAIIRHPIPVTSGDGIRGSLFLLKGHWLYFLSDDFQTLRLLSIFYRNTSKFTGWSNDDKPNGTTSTAHQVVPDPENAGVFYSWLPSGSGRTALFKMTYAGDYTEDVEYGLALAQWDFVTPPAADNMTWENITPASTSEDLVAQVAAYNVANPLPYEFNGLNWDNARFSGVSGTKAFFDLRAGGGGYDTAPCLVAVVDVGTGTLQKMFSTFSGIGGSFEMQARWGECHTTYAIDDFPNSMIISTNILDNGNSLLGGPFESIPTGLKNGDGSWNTNTAMVWPLNAAGNTFDRACPSDIPQWIKDWGATGNQCVTMRLPSSPCFTSPNAAAIAAQTPCPGYSGTRTMPLALAVGDKMYDVATGNRAEMFRVAKITPLTGSELEVVFARNSTWEDCCLNDATNSPRSVHCATGTQIATHANGFTLRMYPGHTGGCGDTPMQFSFGPTGEITYAGEIARWGTGHVGSGTYVDGQNIYSTFYWNKLVSTADPSPLHGKYVNELEPERTFRSKPPTFSSVETPIGDNKVQGYINRGHAGASRLDLQWSLDANALNPSAGGGASISSRTLTAVGGMTDVYDIQLVGTLTSYKKQSLQGWAGFNVYRDVTGEYASINDAPYGSICYNYTAALCGTGVQGKVYVKASRVWDDSQCRVGLVWANSPCVYAGNTASGWLRRGTANIPQIGQMTQNLTMGTAGPGIPGAYWGAPVTATGKAGATYSSTWIDGQKSKVILFKIPSYTETPMARSDFGGLTVKVGSLPGVTYARVRHGHDSQFRCLEATGLACVTDANVTPFALTKLDGTAVDTLTAISCSGGCTIPVNAVPGRLTYYRVETYDGSVWTNGETQVTLP
jgi:hypothetical protein